MEKLLYAACVNLNDENSGITRKVFTQYKTFNNSFNSYLIGYWHKDAIIFDKNNQEKVLSGIRHRRLTVIDETLRLVKNNNFSYVYLRRFPCNSLVINMLKEIRKAGCKKLIWEIPTYPYDYEAKKSMSLSIVYAIDRHYRRQLKKYVDRIVTFSPVNEIFGIHTIHTGNGIDVDSIRPRKVRKNDGSLNLIGVAELQNWHGYDRLIKGLANYKGSREIIFHLVGDGPCLNEYKELANNLGISNRIIFYGAKNLKEIEDIYDKCDMAVESLGWHRAQVKMGTSIKTREYVAKGLPILASSPMDLFPEGWEYAYYAPIDDSPINIEEVLEFYNTIFMNKSTEELATEIRKIAYERCDMKNMMKPIIDYFNEQPQSC